MTTDLQTHAPATDTEAAAGALADRLFAEGLGALHLQTVHLGVKLGLFAALVDQPGSTATELAAHTGLDPWYVREWLQAEWIAGLINADGQDVHRARFSAANGVCEVLVTPTHPAHLSGLPTAAVATASVMPLLLDAFRTGAGIPYSAYGPEAVEAQAALNRPAFVNSLVAEWLPRIPDVLARLQDTDHPARVADLGCGAGWSSLVLATAFPHIQVDGYDTDEDSISRARRNAAERGLTHRVSFEVVDAETGPGSGDYDLVLFLECLHDMAFPARALAAARTMLADGGNVIVMDEHVDDQPRVGDPVETFFATASVLWCLPQGRVPTDSQTPGTLMRPSALQSIAAQAGWSGVEVLPIEHPFWRFYRLLP